MSAIFCLDMFMSVNIEVLRLKRLSEMCVGNLDY